MLYIAIAAIVYGWSALDLVDGEPPADLREALAAVLMCAFVAAVWPPVVVWRALAGPVPAR